MGPTELVGAMEAGWTRTLVVTTGDPTDAVLSIDAGETFRLTFGEPKVTVVPIDVGETVTAPGVITGLPTAAVEARPVIWTETTVVSVGEPNVAVEEILSGATS